MLVNLTDVLSSENLSVKKEVQIEFNSVTHHMGEFSVIEKEPVLLTLTNAGDQKARIEGKTRLVLNMSCDRCLEDVKVTFDLDFSREVIAPAGEKTEDDEDEQNFMEGYHLNVDLLIYSELLMNWPMKVLCQESCEGICTVCGKNLNLGECGCDRFVPDPRMAVIRDIFNANKEV